MEKNLIAFAVWCIWCVFFIGLAIYIWFSKKAIYLTKNKFEVTDIRKFNHAMAKCYVAYGTIFIVLGLPVLAGHFEYILFSIAGVVMETIILWVVYSLVIKKTYKK